MTEGGLSKLAAARQFNTTTKTVAKWVERFRAEGADGLSAPFIARPNPAGQVCADRDIAPSAHDRSLASICRRGKYLRFCLRWVLVVQKRAGDSIDAS